MEKGTIPASSQGLPTSLIRLPIKPDSGCLILTLSIQGRCGDSPSKSSQPSTANSFNSSLEELFSADFLLLVHDLSNPNVENQADVVINTLIEIGFSKELLNTKIINVYNKIDLNSDVPELNIYNKNSFIKTSAINKYGLDRKI